jgi:hypothetical protein
LFLGPIALPVADLRFWGPGANFKRALSIRIIIIIIIIIITYYIQIIINSELICNQIMYSSYNYLKFLQAFLDVKAVMTDDSISIHLVQ